MRYSARMGAHAIAVCLVTLLAWGVQPSTASAQVTGRIDGQVTGQDGTPAQDVQVRVANTTLRTTTNAEGRFTVTGVPAGTQRIVATHIRYGQADEEVAVPVGGSVEVTLELAPSFELDRVLVSVGASGRRQSELLQGSTVLSGRNLAGEVEATLGGTLEGQPGVSSSYFGPGASRPIIRGLGGDRVRVLEGGIDVGDASNTSPDHAVSLEPLAAEQIEVIRGPATLLYGSSAIGGVVNVIDDKIPTERPARVVAGEFTGMGGTVSGELTGQGQVEIATGPLVWSLSGLRRDTDDYEIPGPPELEPEVGAEEGEEEGILENSSLETTRGALGVSWVGSDGYLGVSFSGYDTDYGIPGHEEGEGGEEEEVFVTIGMEQRRVDVEGFWGATGGFFRGLKARFGLNDYEHTEFEGSEVGTRFTNKYWEGRLEAEHALGDRVIGTVGAQLSNRDFAAIGEEAFTPPSETTTFSVFAFERIDLDPLGVEIGGRVETANAKADGGVERDDLTGISASVGLHLPTEGGLAFFLSGTRSTRLPSSAELFSDGPHLATGSFEVGDPDLDEEIGWSVDGGVRLDRGRVRAEVTAFANFFDGYVFVRETGAEEDGLPVFRYSQEDASFNGIEAQAEVELLHQGNHHFSILGTADLVNAELSDSGESLPRIPPFRIGGGARYEGGLLRADAMLRHSAEQDDVAPLETTTGSFTTLDASVSYRIIIGDMAHDLILRATNLTDEEVRLHTSFLKDRAPLPGRDLRIIYRVAF